MTRTFTCAMAVLMLLVTACTGGGATDVADPTTREPAASVAETAANSEAPTSAEPSATPVGEAELSVGWVLPFTVTAPADWGRGEAVTQTAVELVDGPGLRAVLAAFLKSPDAPDAWVLRLTASEAIDASEPQPVEVGGAQGLVFDVHLSDAAPACASGGTISGRRCVIVHGPDGGYAWAILEGRPARIWVLDVEGETVVLMSDAREDRFEAWAQTIEDVVSTLRWAQP